MIWGGDAVDINHYKGGENNGRTEFVNNKTGEKQLMSSSKNIEGYTRRDDKMNWLGIYFEYKKGFGPEKSLFYQDHKMNIDIINSPNFRTAVERYKASGKEKFSTEPFFDPLTPGDNMTAQMLGKASYNFYQIGDKTVIVIIDSKSITSESLNPFNKDESRNVPRIKGKATPESNTHQTYLFILPTTLLKK